MRYFKSITMNLILIFGVFSVSIYADDLKTIKVKVKNQVDIPSPITLKITRSTFVAPELKYGESSKLSSVTLSSKSLKNPYYLKTYSHRDTKYRYCLDQKGKRLALTPKQGSGIYQITIESKVPYQSKIPGVQKDIFHCQIVFVKNK